MALFFDSDWFDARLAANGITRAILAQALGLNEEQIAEVWKDQREISAQQVAIMAVLLAAAPEDVAKHAGISTPVPRQADTTLADIAERLGRVERELAELKAALKKP